VPPLGTAVGFEAGHQFRSFGIGFGEFRDPAVEVVGDRDLGLGLDLRARRELNEEGLVFGREGAITMRVGEIGGAHLKLPVTPPRG